MNSSPSTVRAKTTRSTVKGVERTSPIGPHSQVQKAAPTRSASADTPALQLKSSGSSTKATVTSVTMKSPVMSSGLVQPSKTARLSMMGTSAATHAPT